MGVAAITKMDHWALDDQEAENIAASVANVARHYPKIAGSQKLVDWTMLFGALGMIYVPRVMETNRVLVARKRENANAGS